MFVLDAPYVSDHLRRAAESLGLPVLRNAVAEQHLGRTHPVLLGTDEFVAHWHASHSPRLYTNSENALGWVAQALANTPLPAQVNALKDKVLFRDLLAPSDPGYRYQECHFDDLDDVDLSGFEGAFVVKPAVGFFSLGVKIVAGRSEWAAVARSLREDRERFEGLYPEVVLDLDRFVLEEVIEGAEFAVDAYYDSEGRVVIVGILEHPFSDGADVSDRVYRTRPSIIERWHDPFVDYLQDFGRRVGLRDFPAHVELRVDAQGTIRAIEANPLRFGGWCASDVAIHAWGRCPYTTFLRDERPDWASLCEERRGYTTALVVADLPSDLDRRRVSSIDYDAFVARFDEPLELRRVEDPRHPVFAFLFVRVADTALDQLEEILHADLTQYVRLG